MNRRLVSRFLLSILPLLLPLLLLGHRVEAASLFAIVEGNGVEISDEEGFAEIPLEGSATISVFLRLEPEELASTFDAGFALVTLDAIDAVVDLGRVDPGLAPFEFGTWSDASASIDEDEVRVALVRDNLGGESLVAEIVVTSTGAPGLFELILGDREASFDLAESPFFELVPIDTGIGTPLATILVPEPGLLLQGIASLLILATLRSCKR
jgi:hypothetical protein